MTFDEIVRERYSCRKFSGKKVERALLEEIAEAGRLAPTAKNLQPVKVFLMESEEAKAAVRGVTGCSFGAGSFLVVGARPEDGWHRPYDGKAFAEVDAAIVATHMLLKITELGLAATWVGWFDAPRLRELCPAMADYELIALFPVGYAAEDAEPSPRHSQRKSPEDFLQTL